MAQMPRGKPRSVPDPAGEQYDEMIQQQRLKRLVAEDAQSFGREYLSPTYHPDWAKQLPPTPITSENARFCTDPPTASPAQLAEQQQAIDRVSFMTDHPLAGAAYGLAALAHASPEARDDALVAGGAADSVLMGAAPFGVTVRSRPPAPKAAPETSGLNRENIRAGTLSARGQATGVGATLTRPLLGTGTRANWRKTPPGWQGDGNLYNEARAHLLARQLGGPGQPWNIVTMTDQGANRPQMSSFEAETARRVRSGEIIDYSSTPLYAGGAQPPSVILLTALGSRQPPTAKLIHNPAGTPR
jgi:hypothetical protein